MLAFAACKKTEGTFTVGFDQNFPPMGFVGDDGEYTGFDLELAAEVAKRMKMELKLQPIDWDSKDMELESGNVDCIWNGFTINGREELYTWTDPYGEQAGVCRQADSGINTLEGLAGRGLPFRRIQARRRRWQMNRNWLKVSGIHKDRRL